MLIAGLLLAGSLPANDARIVPDRPAACLRAERDVPPGEALDRAAFAPADCTDAATRAGRLDRARGEVRANRPIAAGEIVRAWLGSEADRVRSGDILSLNVEIGGVRIEREVEALQGASAGARLFVRAKDGQIFSARYETAAP